MLRLLHFFHTKLTGDIFDIIENDDSESLATLIQTKEAADNCHMSTGSSLFYRACCGNKYHCLLYLLKIGTNPDLHNQNKMQWTPLYFAVRNNLVNLIHLLIMHGAQPDNAKPDSDYATPRNMANSEIKKIINEAEQRYKAFLSLTAEYTTLKTQADKAYKKPNMKEAGLLYQAAAEKYEKISKIWEQLYDQEENEILKAYYKEQQQRYLNGAATLNQVVNIESHSVFIESKESAFSQIRQRKTHQQKQQVVSEEQSNQLKSLKFCK